MISNTENDPIERQRIWACSARLPSDMRANSKPDLLTIAGRVVRGGGISLLDNKTVSVDMRVDPRMGARIVILPPFDPRWAIAHKFRSCNHCAPAQRHHRGTDPMSLSDILADFSRVRTGAAPGRVAPAPDR